MTDTERAARQNAEWCGLVCEAHGLRPRRTDRVWVSRTRTPEGYPDAISLQPDVRADELLALIDDAPGCSVKDSYCSLDLRSDGFDVLFDAHWIWAPPDSTRATTGDDGSWTVVAAPGTRHGGWSAAVPALLTVPPPAVLASPQVTWLVRASGDHVTGSAVAHRTDDVVGVSNVGLDVADPAAAWTELLAVVQRLSPASPVAGYERDASLAAATAAGFQRLGPLRVWSRT